MQIPCLIKTAVLSCGKQVAVYEVQHLPRELLCLCNYVCMMALFFWGHSLISAWRRKGGKKYLSSIASRFLFSKRLENLLMYKRWCLLFLLLTAHEETRSSSLSDFQDGKSVWLLFALESGQHFLRDVNCWDGWVRSGLDSVQSCSVPQNIFLRVHLCRQFVTVPACSITALSSFECLHPHTLLGCRVDIWNTPCRTNSWCTWKLTLWAPWTMQWKLLLHTAGGFLRVSLALRSP